MAHWRDSSRTVRLWVVDYRACFPLLLFLMHIRLWTFAVAFIAIGLLAALEYYGFTVAIFTRWLRSFVVGPRKISQPWWKK